MLAVATEADVPGMLAIYAPLVRETCITWELEPPSTDELATRVAQALDGGFPWLVARAPARDGGSASEVAGYAYAHPFRARRGYRFSCESSIYVHADHRGRGVGDRLYGALFECLRRQGFVAVVAGVTLPNDASLRLHARHGFRRVGTFEGIGHKHGRWLDAAFLQRELAPREAAAAEEPTAFRALLAAGALADRVAG